MSDESGEIESSGDASSEDLSLEIQKSLMGQVTSKMYLQTPDNRAALQKKQGAVDAQPFAEPEVEPVPTISQQILDAPSDSEGDSTGREYYRSYIKKLEGDDAKVLDPENPLLEKFQAALKEHLLYQIEALKDEIFGNETAIRKKTVEKEELGVAVYEFQQMIRQQQTVLDKWAVDLQTMTAAKEEVEKQMEEKLEVFKKEREELNEVEKQDIELRNEIEAMHYLIQQMTNWEKEVEDNITVNKTISEKTRKEKQQLMEEKRQQDMLIYKLMQEVWRLEGEIEHLDMQLRVMESERERLAQNIAVGNTNISAIAQEQRYLTHSWNSVLVSIGMKDKTINCLKEELHKLNRKFKALVTEVEQVGKLTQKEQGQHENHTMVKHRIEIDSKLCKAQYADELAKRVAIDKAMADMQLIVEQTERDIQRTVNENNAKSITLRAVHNEYDKLGTRKTELEQKILSMLEDETTSNKATKNLCVQLDRAKGATRIAEIQVAESENKNAMVLMDVEMQKFEVQNCKRTLAELERQLDELEVETAKHNDEAYKCQFTINKRQRIFDLLNDKLAKLQADTQASMTKVLQVKIASLEKNIEELEEENKELQKFWLREQRNLVALSEQHQEQVHDINLMRKQLMILEQKNLQMNDLVEEHRKIEEKMQRNVHTMRRQMTNLCDSLCKKKGMKEILDKGNEVLEQQYSTRLRDAELECLRIQADIADIENDKVNFSSELVELNREALEWEKKFILVKETRQTMDDEKAKGGEIATMKKEIQRMSIRYTHLKKAQEKLMQDLEHCIYRRESIFTAAEAKEQRVKRGNNTTRIIYYRKLDDMKNRVKQASNEVAKIERTISRYNTLIDKYKEDIDEREAHIATIQDRTEALRNQIDEAQTNQEMNFEILLLKQKKLNMYSDLARNAIPYTVYRTEAALTSEYTKQKEVNTSLCLVVANLAGDFPQYQHLFNRMMNTLKLPTFISYV